MAVAQEASAPAVNSTQAEAQAPRLALTPEQRQALADQETSSNIMTMFQDPEIVAILTDSSFIEAVQTADKATLEANPRFKQLTENPKYKALIEKIKSEEEASPLDQFR